MRLIRDTSGAVEDLQAAIAPSETITSDFIDTGRIVSTLRSSVQQASRLFFTSTTLPPAKATTTSGTQASSTRPPLRHTHSQAQSNPSFLRILRCFLTRATHTYSPSLSHLRSVLSEIFAAYTFEETILNLANRFLDKEASNTMHEITELRNAAGVPARQVCEGCKKRAWARRRAAPSGMLGSNKKSSANSAASPSHMQPRRPRGQS